MKTLYFECYSGISGDMAVGALLDFGIDPSYLLKAISSISLSGFQIAVSKIHRNGICATTFDVTVFDKTPCHKSLEEIKNSIYNSSISLKAKILSINMLEKIAKVKYKVYGRYLEEFDFYKSGILQSVIDFVSVSVLIDLIKLDKIVFSPLYEGTGYKETTYGIVPVPSFEVLEILKCVSAPIKITLNIGQMITPSGAAIVSSLCDEFVYEINLFPEKIGYGARKDLGNGVLRAILGETAQKREEIIVIKTRLDNFDNDNNGDIYDIFKEKCVKNNHFTL